MNRNRSLMDELAFQGTAWQLNPGGAVALKRSAAHLFVSTVRSLRSLPHLGRGNPLV
jgi:hypothetical protein